MGILLLAVLLGRPAPVLIMLLVVCGLDAWLRIERVMRLPGMHAPVGAEVMQKFVDEDGSFTATARWVTLGVTLLAVFFVPQSSAWRF